MQGVLEAEHVADRVRGGQRHRERADDRGVEERDREQDACDPASVRLQACSETGRVGEVAGIGVPSERRSGDSHDRAGPEDHHDDADPEIGLLVLDEARGDALIDHVALLEEQLPGSDGRPDDADDQQHHGGQLPGSAGQDRSDETAGHLRGRGVGEEVDRDQQQ